MVVCQIKNLKQVQEPRFVSVKLRFGKRIQMKDFESEDRFRILHEVCLNLRLVSHL